MSSIQSVAIAGASGNIGVALLKELVESKRFSVVVLTRTESTATFPTGAKVLKTDYTSESLNTIFSAERFDAAISAINALKPGALEADCALIQAANAHGVKRFIPSEFGIDITNPAVVDAVPTPMWSQKLKPIQLLKSLESDTFAWTAITCGLWFDWGLQRNVVAVNFQEKKFQRFDGGDHPFSVTNQATVGKAVVNLLSDDNRLVATANQNIYIASHTITNNQVIAAVQKVTGERWPVEDVDSEALEKTLKEALEGGNFSAAGDLMKTGIFGRRELGDHRKSLSNDLLGLEVEDFEAQLKEIVTSIIQK